MTCEHVVAGCAPAVLHTVQRTVATWLAFIFPLPLPAAVSLFANVVSNV